MPHEEISLVRGSKIQLRVIGALLMREVLTRYGRHNIGFLWLFVEPMIFTLGVATLWSHWGFHRVSSIPIVAFALTGYSSVLLWRNMPSRCVNAIDPNRSLMYHRNVRLFDIYASRILLEAIGATASFAILSAIFIFAGWMEPPEDPLKVMVAWLLLGAFGFGLALLFGAWSTRSHAIEKLWHPATYLLFPLSGAAFNVDALPPDARSVILTLPMVNGAEMLRDGYFGASFHAHYSAAYLAAVSAALILAGLAMTRDVSRDIVLE